MTDSNLKAKAEAATADAFEKFREVLHLADKEMVIDVAMKYTMEYRKLQSELTALKAQVDGAINDTELLDENQALMEENRTLRDQVDGAFNEGVEEAAKILKKRWKNYDAEHGHTDYETGTREYPGNGDEMMYEWQEIEEEIRTLSQPAIGVVNEDVLRKVLAAHWLAEMKCDHIRETNQVRCSCSLVQFPIMNSVGKAAQTWIDHVIEQYRNLTRPTKPTEAKD